MNKRIHPAFKLTLLLLALAATTLPASGQWTVGEWHQGTNGHYYSVQAITGPDNSWLIARSQARVLIAPNGRPADLATLASSDENAFVFAGIDDPAYWAIDGANNNEGPNIGGYQYDKNNEPAGDWTWVTGEPWSFTNWSPGEPNNNGGNEDVLTFFAQGNNRAPTWNDIATGTGSVIHYYVAESTDQQPCTPPPPGMVSWWPGDGNANDIQDGNNGKIMNGATFADGLVSRAFSFNDELDQFVQVPDAPNIHFGPTTPMSVDFWVYRTSISQTQHFVGKREGCFMNDGTFQIGLDFVFSQCGLFFGPPIAGQGVCSGLDLPLNTWTHLAGTFDGTTQRLYMDGTPIGEVTGSLGPENNAPLLIGQTSLACTGAVATGGLIDEVEIFNRALSPQEIQAIVNAGSAGKCKSLPRVRPTPRPRPTPHPRPTPVR